MSTEPTQHRVTAHTKYVVFPGFVYSNNGGQRHYVSAVDLMRLYRVTPDECVIAEKLERPIWYELVAQDQMYRGLIRLTPKADGVYVIPERAPVGE